MSTSAGDYNVPNVSKQLTKNASVFTKLEWRIEDISRFPAKRSLHHICKPYGNLMYIHVENSDTLVHTFTFASKDSKRQMVLFPQITERVLMADYKIYLLSSTNEERAVAKSVTKFEVGTTAGSWQGGYEEIAGKFIHPDGSLLVICEVNCLAPEETFSMESAPNLQLTNNFKELWKSQLFSDCTLEVGAKSFPAHKCILGQWSQVFRNMFSLPMEEAESGVVEISDFGSDEISAMLEYMYTGVVKDEVMYKQAPELLALSDKYAVIPLKDLCEAFLASKLTTTNFLQIVILADRYSAAKLKKACINRLAIDGRAVLQSKEWEDLKSKDKDLANELLELMIKFC
ncbi:BTB/POZ domain-containing protein [Ditylenchus destructor]|nr:BTB/POZ domain-containing protein [Ditylenchus destructor]